MAKGLGKGLNAFFPNELDDSGEEEIVQEVKVNELRPNPYQPRKTFSEEAIEELKVSIESHGVLQPLIVRKSIKGYDIVVGERRFRASQAAGLETVPAVVKDLTDEDMMEIALIENLQREDLNPLEEARAYEKLMVHLNITQEQLSERLGKSRPHIANHVRLLQLPTEVQMLMVDGKLSMGHGRTLLGLKEKKHMGPAAQKIVNESMNVRQAEELVQRLNEGTKKKKKAEEKPSLFLKAKEDELRNFFGTSVSIKKGRKKGKIEIEFFSEEDLNRIIHLLDHEE